MRNLSVGEHVVLTRDCCPDVFTTIRKGTRGVVIKAATSFIYGMEYKVRFDGIRDAVTISHDLASKIFNV